MKYKAPESFYFQGGSKAILLLHSFTGSTIDMRQLGKFLNREGYTVHAPMYTGHGQKADTLLQYGPSTWWEDVQSAYEFLEDEGYEEIVVMGLSLGAVLTLKVAHELNPLAIVTMSLPMTRDEVTLRKRVVYYAKQHQQYEEGTDEEKEAARQALKAHPMEIVPAFIEMIEQQMQHLEQIQVPIYLAYGGQDDALYEETANYVAERIGSTQKVVTCYEQAGHLMTYGKDAKTMYEDFLHFLQHLHWKK
ncbi:MULTISPECIES: alpha/beta hydrolase [Kurthia]|uniref:alpha/beta hydrolase n=1 Tax=Kurthia TaxID=1649 RepID=UPI001143E42B|nr:alpha/beta fold hydrolase [Kurthia gibsonii]GED19791.1 carboxylesterase [Kurthia gibsonii]